MKTIDATDYIPKEKHPAIMSLFFSLAVGESMLLINDHDPKPLRYQFQAEYTDMFTWKYIATGPDIYKVVITKTKEVHND